MSSISSPNSILYACISRGTVVIAEYSSGDTDLVGIALQCLEKVPQLHVSFTHTVREKTYVFLMEDPFIYFAIFKEAFGKPEGFQFLERLKDSFVKFFKTKSGRGGKNSTSVVNGLMPLCYQEDFRKVFTQLVMSSGEDVEEHSRSSSGGNLDSRLSGKKFISVPLLGGYGSGKHSKKKKKKSSDDEMHGDGVRENKVDVIDDDTLSREFSVSLQKTGRQCAKKMWRRHVGIVLLVDLILCCILFGAWLFVCQGFKCIAS